MASYKRSGTLQGTDMVETVIFTVDLPAKITYMVTAKGSGDNRLRVRCGQKLIAIWAQVHDFKLSPGESATKSLSTDLDGTTPTTDRRQDIRIRLSRDILTKSIDWQLHWTVD